MKKIIISILFMLTVCFSQIGMSDGFLRSHVTSADSSGVLGFSDDPFLSINFMKSALVRAMTIDGKLTVLGTTQITGDSMIVNGSFHPNSFESTSPQTSLNIGRNSGKLAMSGAYNTLIGYGAGSTLGVGANESMFGYYAGKSTTGTGNSFFGSQSGYTNGTGTYNCFFGYFAGQLNSTGSYNSYFGAAAGINATGKDNSGFGRAALRECTGNYNAAVGDSAGYNITTGSRNSIFGAGVTLDNATDNDMTIFGNKSGSIIRKSLKINNADSAATFTGRLTINKTLVIAGTDSTGTTPEGRIFYDAVLHVLKCWDGTSWKKLW